MDDIKRGEIFYIARGATSGSEQFADRPAVVVSNDENNKHSGVIEVAYLTTAPKTDLPTHVTIRSTGRTSTVLCEQVTSVSVDRVNKYIGQVSEQEMKNIDIALMISLAIGEDTKSSKVYREERRRQQEEIKRLKTENETLKAEKAACGANTEPHRERKSSSPDGFRRVHIRTGMVKRSTQPTSSSRNRNLRKAKRQQGSRTHKVPHVRQQETDS